MTDIDFTQWTDRQLAVAAQPRYKKSPNHAAVLAEIKRRDDEWNALPVLAGRSDDEADLED